MRHVLARSSSLLVAASAGHERGARQGRPIAGASSSAGTGSRAPTATCGPLRVPAGEVDDRGRVRAATDVSSAASVDPRASSASRSVAFDGSTDGLSADGRRSCSPRSGRVVYGGVSRFAVLSHCASLRLRQTIVLAGPWSFDALSPDGRSSTRSSTQRADSRATACGRSTSRRGTLQREADRRPARGGRAMSGTPVTRAQGRAASGRTRCTPKPDGTAFVHALDTRARQGALHRAPLARASREGRVGVRMRVQRTDARAPPAACGRARDDRHARVRRACARRPAARVDVLACGGSGRRQRLGRVRDLPHDLDDVAVRVPDAQLPVGAVAAVEDLRRSPRAPARSRARARAARARAACGGRAARSGRGCGARWRGPSPAPRARSARRATCSRSSGSGGSDGISSPASYRSQSCFTSAWQYAVIATASSTRVTASQIRISIVPRRGCRRTSHQMCV